MKKIWKIRKDSEAVSPVIATILMVAITVVLAAVLYVMVMGFGGTGTQQPTGQFTTYNKVSSDEVRITLTALNPETTWVKLELRVEYEGAQVGTDNFALTTADVDIDPNAVDCSLHVVDLAGDDKVSAGDYIVIETDVPASTDLPAGDYTIQLIFVDTGGQIAQKSFVV